MQQDFPSADTALTTGDSDSLIFSHRDLWYFKTFDGDEIGPFRYRSEAETGLGRFLSQQGQDS